MTNHFHPKLVANVALSALLAGCANWQTVYRNQESAGKTVAIDATQRVVVSTVSVEAGNQVVRYCPEPSPDAIAAFAASLGIAASVPAKGSSVDASLQQAAASQVAAIGLRTPTTQVIRDLITAACIAHMNGAFKDPGFKDAFERNQDFVLAAHAIAVIGGEPVARQFMLNSSAGTGANSSDVRAAFVDLKGAEATRAKAESDLADAKEAKGKAAKDSEDANKALAAEKAKPNNDPAIAAAQKTADEKKGALDEATKAEAGATKKLADAKSSEKNAQTAFTAVSTGQSTAGGSGAEASPASLARAAATVNLSDKAIGAIGSIVNATLLSGFSLERCINHLIEVSKLQVADPMLRNSLMTSVANLCNTNLTIANTQAEIRKQEAVRQLMELD